MLVLITIAIVAGAGTAVTPCVLPVLPAILSAGAAGGRRRPLGILLGLGATFTVSIIALAQLTRGVGLAAGAPRTVAAVVLIGAGVLMLVPPLSARVQAPLSRLARFGPRTSGHGFWSGLAVGGALGLVCAPCAGPILAAVISLSASGQTSARLVAVALAYVAGLCAMLALYTFGGRRVIGAIRRRFRGPLVEAVIGVMLLGTGVAIATNLDVRFESVLARATAGAGHSGLLAFLVDPTRGLESSGTVQRRLAALRPTSRFLRRAEEAAAAPVAVLPGVSIPGVRTPPLPDLGPAPNFTDTQDWFNTPGGRPLSLPALRGKVVLVDFWTYTCINCIRTLPFIESLYRTYRRDGLVVVGVETPEFTFEQEASNVRAAIAADGITYPVVQDNHYGTWDAYQNEYWPADYLIDSRGEVRHTQFGEGDYLQEEAAVRQLLHDAGARSLPAPIGADALLPSPRLGSYETYLNPRQYDQYGQRWAQPIRFGTHRYAGRPALTPNSWALSGAWAAGAESITPAGAAPAEVSGDFEAERVYLVMTSQRGVARRCRVLLNGRPVPRADAGADVGAGGYLTVRGERLYSLISLPEDRTGVISVQLAPGVSAYDFTFG
jgi:cytochrome c biogenesis protein CcdA/thiol-disulfide isomerase/thioredoxin